MTKDQYFNGESQERDDHSDYKYGVVVSTEIIVKGKLREFLRKIKDFEKHYFLKSPDLGPFLDKLRNILQYNRKKFMKLFESTTKFSKILRDESGVDLHKFISLPDHPSVKEKLTQLGLEKSIYNIDRILTSKNTSIFRRGSKLTFNFCPENLDKFKIGNQEMKILPLDYWDTKGVRDQIHEWYHKFYEEQGRSPKRDEAYSEIGKIFFDREARLYGRTQKDILRALNIPLNQRDWNDPARVQEIYSWFKYFYANNGRSPKWEEVVKEFGGGFYQYEKRTNGRTHNDVLEALNLPLNFDMKYDWTNTEEIQNVYNWIKDFFEKIGRSPTQGEVADEFGYGFRTHEKRVEGRSHNGTLEALGLPLSYERKYEWTDPAKVEEAYKWFKDFYEHNGRSPTVGEVYDKLGYGFRLYEKREHKRTHNDTLGALGLPLNYERQHDWTNQEELQDAYEWYKVFYDKNGRAPTEKEVMGKFGQSVLDYERRVNGRTPNDILRNLGIPLNQKDWNDPVQLNEAYEWMKKFYEVTGRSPTVLETAAEFGYGFAMHERQTLRRNHNDTLKALELPISDLDQALKEGHQFDRVGKECLECLSENIIVSPRVYNHALLEGEYVVPDGINHNFANNPLVVQKKSIYLKEGQRLDTITDLKRSYSSIQQKDWEIYTKLAKNLRFYLLKGKSPESIKLNDCNIEFYDKNDLIQQLKSEITSMNETKIRSLISEINNIDFGIDNKSQKRLEAFL